MLYKPRQVPLTWQQIEVAHELTRSQLNGVAVEKEYFISLVNENLSENLALIDKIIEERRTNNYDE